MIVCAPVISEPRALIFDMDGLMIDSEPLWFAVEVALAESYGKRWTHTWAQECVGTGLPNTARTMAEKLDLPFGSDDGAQLLVQGFMRRVSELELKPGFRELLEAARAAQLPCALASASTQALLNTVVDRFELRTKLQAIVAGEVVPINKPAPDIFLHAAAQLDTAPAGCVVLEDSVPGVQAGVAAGMMVIAVPEIDDPRFAVLTPHVTRDLHEAKSVLAL